MEKAILRTLTYADLFDYPLTPEEIFRFLIAKKRVTFPSLQRNLTRLVAEKKKLGVDAKGRFFFLPGRKEIVPQRKRRAIISREKLNLARKAAQFLKIIPTVQLIGITGRLAMENVEAEDDLDFLIITAANRLWLTRLLVIVVLELLGKRRRPDQKKVKDKICLNMFLDEGQLALLPGERDLYTAHEVIQMKPLWDRCHVYAKFLEANRWVTKHLSHGLSREQPKISPQKDKQEILSSRFFDLLELVARRFQFWYLSKRRTTEVVTARRALFHPESARNWVLAAYEKKLAEYGLSDES